MERPVANDSQPLTVVFTLSLIQIMDVVGVRNSFLLRVFFFVFFFPVGWDIFSGF